MRETNVNENATSPNQRTLDEWMKPTKIKCENCRKMYSKNLRLSHVQNCSKMWKYSSETKFQSSSTKMPATSSPNEIQDDDDDDIQFIGEFKTTPEVSSNSKKIETIDVDDDDENSKAMDAKRPRLDEDSSPICIISTVHTIKKEEFMTLIAENDKIIHSDDLRDGDGSPSLLEPIRENTEKNYDENSELEELIISTNEDAVQIVEDDRRSPELFDETSFSQKTLLASTPIKKIRSVDVPSTSSKTTVTDEDNDDVEIGNPYYLRIFDQILNRIRNEKFFGDLFSANDREIFNKFDHLNDGAKICFIRLFTRKFGWNSPKDLRNTFPYQDLVYISDRLRELKQQYFVDSIVTCRDVKELLNLLSAAELRKLAVENRIVSGSCNLRKEKIVEMFINELKAQSAICGDRTRKVLETLHEKLESYCRIKESVRLVFLSVFHLYSPQDMSSSNLHTAGNSRRSLAQELIFLLLKKETGEIKFVNRTGERRTAIFSNRQQLANYVKATEFESALIDSSEHKHFDECFEHGILTKIRLVECLSDSDQIEYERQMPKALRRFTATYVYVRCTFAFVEAAQRLKKYQDAVDLLFFILDNVDGAFTPNRDQYYERLCINLKDRLRQPEKAFEVIERAFKDRHVKEHGKQNLREKAIKLTSILRSKVRPTGEVGKKRQRSSDADDPWPSRLDNLLKLHRPLKEIREKIIYGDVLEKYLGGKRKNIFIQDDRIDVPVEDIAINDYKKNENFTEALHDEGSALKSMFGLLLWNEIYDHTVPDVWQSSQQVAPLDLNDSGSFSLNRPTFSSKITQISQASDQIICQWIDDVWSNHHGTRSIVHWECFDDVEQAKRLASCVGGMLMSTLFLYLSYDYKSRRSGFPDLILWNFNARKFKVVEVKGPKDVLSTKQKIWLSQFTEWNVDAELCKVVAKNGRRIETSAATADS